MIENKAAMTILARQLKYPNFKIRFFPKNAFFFSIVQHFLTALILNDFF
jgi:hypothetical protein